MSLPLLTVLTFLPLVGVLLLLFAPRRNKAALYGTALAVSLLVFALAVVLYARFDPAEAGPQFVERHPWLGYGIQYHLGVDGISLPLVLLTAFLVPIAILSSWSAVRDRIREYLIFLLALETGVLGIFLSLNLFLFYVFWEAMLVPMYFLIGLWGGPRRIYATMKFVIFTMTGSLLMLAALIVLGVVFHRATGVYSFDVFELAQAPLDPRLQLGLFAAFGLAFAVKVPLVPFHTWLPDAHVEAPTAGSVLLAGLLLKLGAYGFLRYAFPLFPSATRKALPVLAVLAVAGIIYGGLMALVQKDVKSLVAYSSVSHMGLIMLAALALNVEGLQGALLQMVNHGLSTGGLFLAVGMLYERAHTRRIADFGGVSRRMPVFAAFFLVVLLSSAGLPGLNGFVGEILCFYGVLAAHKIWAVLAVTTVVLAAAYLLWMYQRVMHGPVANDRVRALPDLGLREIAVLVPVVIMMIWIGVHPSTFLGKTEATVRAYVERVRTEPRIIVDGAAGKAVRIPGQAGAGAPGGGR